MSTPAMGRGVLPPGPSYPNAIAQIRMMQQFLAAPFDWFSSIIAQHGLPFTMNAGDYRQVMISDPDMMYEVLLAQASKFHKDRDYKDTQKGIARFMGNGLVTSDGEFWKRQRKLAAPAFHARRIQSYADAMVDLTQRQIADWHDGARLDIARQMMTLTLKIISQTMFHLDADTSLIERIDHAMEAVQQAAGGFDVLPTWLPTPKELRARRARRDLDDIVYRLIADWRKTGEDRGDLLSMLLMARDEDGSGMTDLQARDELVTIFLAGHETTANALNWTFYLLAQHPAVEARLHAELDAVLGGRAPTLADLERLPYTEMVIKESMRLFPPVWSVARQAIEPVQLGDYHLPRGTAVGVLIYFAHRDPRWFPDPEQFDPERFNATNEPTIRRYTYLPFGGGPRICLGNSFAMMEARLLLASIASRYTLRLLPGHRVEPLPLITLNPKGGLPMTVYAPQPQPVPAGGERELISVR